MKILPQKTFKLLLSKGLIVVMLLMSSMPIYAQSTSLNALTNGDGNLLVGENSISYFDDLYNATIHQNYLSEEFSKFSYTENGEKFEVIIDNSLNKYVVDNKVYSENSFFKASETQANQMINNQKVTPLNKLLEKYPNTVNTKKYNAPRMTMLATSRSIMDPPTSGYGTYRHVQSYKGPDYVKAMTVTAIVAIAGKAVLSLSVVSAMLGTISAKLGSTIAFFTGTVFGVYAGSFTIHFDKYQALHKTNTYAASNKIVMYTEVLLEGGQTETKSTTEYTYFFHTRPY